MNQMKLNKNFLVHKSGKDTVIVPTGNAGFLGLIKGNETLGVIVDLLKTDTTEQQLIDQMTKQFDAPREVIEKDVKSVVSRLKEIGAIDG